MVVEVVGTLRQKNQVILMCTQLVEQVFPRYDREGMEDIPGRRHLTSELKSADKEVAVRGADQKERHFEDSGRPMQSSEEWHNRRVCVGKQLTRVEISRKQIASLTPSMRIFSVIVEKKIQGQKGNTRVFWSNVAWKELPTQVGLSLPLIHSILAKVQNLPSLTVEAKGKMKQMKPLAKRDDYLGALSCLVKLFFVPPPACDHATAERMGAVFCERCKTRHLGGCVMCYLIPDDKKKEGNYFERVLIRHWWAQEKRGSLVSGEAKRRKEG